jgi:hypothetical protein
MDKVATYNRSFNNFFLQTFEIIKPVQNYHVPVTRQELPYSQQIIDSGTLEKIYDPIPFRIKLIRRIRKITNYLTGKSSKLTPQANQIPTIEPSPTTDYSKIADYNKEQLEKTISIRKRYLNDTLLEDTYISPSKINLSIPQHYKDIEYYQHQLDFKTDTFEHENLPLDNEDELYPLNYVLRGHNAINESIHSAINAIRFSDKIPGKVQSAQIIPIQIKPTTSLRKRVYGYPNTNFVLNTSQIPQIKISRINQDYPKKIQESVIEAESKTSIPTSIQRTLSTARFKQEKAFETRLSIFEDETKPISKKISETEVKPQIKDEKTIHYTLTHPIQLQKISSKGIGKNTETIPILLNGINAINKLFNKALTKIQFPFSWQRSIIIERLQSYKRSKEKDTFSNSNVDIIDTIKKIKRYDYNNIVPNVLNLLQSPFLEISGRIQPKLIKSIKRINEKALNPPSFPEQVQELLSENLSQSLHKISKLSSPLFQINSDSLTRSSSYKVPPIDAISYESNKLQTKKKIIIKNKLNRSSLIDSYVNNTIEPQKRISEKINIISDKVSFDLFRNMTKQNISGFVVDKSMDGKILAEIPSSPISIKPKDADQKYPEQLTSNIIEPKSFKGITSLIKESTKILSMVPDQIPRPKLETPLNIQKPSTQQNNQTPLTQTKTSETTRKPNQIKPIEVRIETDEDLNIRELERKIARLLKDEARRYGIY